MAGVISDIQQIYDWIVYLKDIHDTIKGDRHRCQHLSTRCQQFESNLNNLDYKNQAILKGVLVVHSSIKNCVKFIDKYRKSGVLRSMRNIAFSKQIETEFQGLNISLSQAANDLQFGIIVSSKASSDLKDLVSTDDQSESHDSGHDSSKKIFESVQFTKIDRSALDWDNRKFIGKGSFASVYSCLYGGKQYAVKHFENLNLLSDSQLRTVRREVKILQLTRHENIISFIGFHMDEGMLVCELAQGTLHEVLYKGLRFNGIVNPDNLKVKVNWLLDLAQALCYLHHHGIIHRDIKPLNTLMVVDTAAKKVILKIADFGIASMMGVTMGTMTSAGSPLYVAPEVIGATSTIDAYTSAIDMYSFGVLANELFTVEPPWKGCNFWQVMDGVRSGMRPQLYRNDDESMQPLIRLIGDASMGCLSALPSGRPSSYDTVNELIVLSERCHSRFDELKELADGGDAYSQCQLGLCYLVGTGNGLTNDVSILEIYVAVLASGWLEEVSVFSGIKSVSSNYEEAFKYFKLSADQGNALAQYFVGKCYNTGLGIEKDSSLSFEYFQKSALQGDAAGLNAIGACYFEGLNIEKNLIKAFQNFTVSAQQGYSVAQCNVGCCYDYGNGVAMDKVKAFKYYQLSADQGHADAQFNVGCCYDDGEGVEMDKVEAFKYYKLAAAQGDASAQFFVGVCYEDGEGVAMDIEEAFEYFKLAADQGHTAAQFMVGCCYDKGEGVAMDIEEAFKYFKLAADQGHTAAQFNVGCCFDDGDGVSADTVEAFKYFKLAADQGHIAAQFIVGSRLVKDDGVAVDTVEAFKYFKLAADQGHATAQNNVGWCYDKGEGVAVNKVEAFKHFKLAANRGHAAAQFNVGCCYDNGDGVAMDKVQAFKHFKLAADRRHATAQFIVGCCYDKGEGVAMDEVEAFKYYKLAADGGHAAAQFNVGCCYDDGEGVAMDKVEAFKYFKLAADQGDASAQFIVGFYCENGVGSVVDKVEAFKYYKLAADQGDADAQFHVGCYYGDGDGVAVDKAEAFKYFKLAADQGHTAAQFSVANCYFNGWGVAVVNEESSKYYKLTAEQGNVDSHKKK